MFSSRSKSPPCHQTTVCWSVVFTFSVPPVIMGASEEFMEEMGAVVNSTVVLHCDTTGHPAPVISWLKDGQPLHTDSQHHISEDGTQLQVGHH